MKKEVKINKYMWIAVAIIVGIAAFVIISLSLSKDNNADRAEFKDMKLEKVKTNVDTALISPLGNKTVLDLSDEGNCVFTKAGQAESVTYGGKTVEIGKFTDRTDITVDELAEYIAGFSEVAYLDIDGSDNTQDVLNSKNLGKALFAGRLNNYIENDMSAENNSFSIVFCNGDEVKALEPLHDGKVQESETKTERPNKLMITVTFSPKNESGEAEWTKDNTFVSEVNLLFYNTRQSQESFYGLNSESIVNTYANYAGDLSVLIWKLNFSCQA